MRILFLNQYFPPDTAPTGILLRELGDYLAAQGHAVEYVSAAQAYRGGQGKRGRLFRELGGLWELVRRGWRAQRPDVVFSATSPPCLLIIATVLAQRHRARSVHWIMDLYPELVPALGKVKPAFLVAPFKVAMAWGYYRTALTVSLDADMAARLKWSYGVSTPVIQPWVFSSMLPALEAALAAEPATPVRSGTWRWIYSGNLGQAHEWATLLDAQKLLEQQGVPAELVFQGGGPQRPQAQARAAELGLQRCQWLDYAPEEELPRHLLAAQACVATQRLSARGLLWPSKLGLLQCLPRPIIWVGDKAGAIAAELQSRPGSGVFAPGEAPQLAAWIQQQIAHPTLVPASALKDARTTKERALAEWAERLAQLVP